MTLQDVTTVIKQVKADSTLDVKPDSLLTDLNITSLDMMIIICDSLSIIQLKFQSKIKITSVIRELNLAKL